MVFLLGVHIFGLVAVVVLLIPALRDDNSDTGEDGDSDDGWGNRPNVKPDPSRWPGGGLPLPDAEQSAIRLRGHGRLGDRHPTPERRPVHEPLRRPVRAHD